MRRLFFCVLALFLVSTACPSFSQQTEITPLAVFGAYSYLVTPSLNLTRRGFDGDLGYNFSSWLSFGFDFGYYNGHSSLLPHDLSAGAPVLPELPPTGVPYNISTYTYGGDRNSITAN